ncbi:hypothetical protein V1509DRAFT_2915 [Lipomyces kononenkoae]
MSPSKTENLVSDFENALDLLKNNPAEQRLDVHMPYSRYQELEECWSKIKSARIVSEDQKYPSLEYNSAAEIVTVITVPRDLHEIPAVELGRLITSGAEEYLYSHGADASFIGGIANSGTSTRKGGQGDYSKSTKQADVTIKYTRNARDTIMIAIEVGFSENYTALCRDKDLWIEGQNVKVCILVCLDESPRFRNPRTQNEDVKDVDGEVETMRQHVVESVERDSSQGYHGCIEYRGRKWVGDLRSAFIEVWRANKRHATRYPLIQYGWSCNRLPKTIGLKIRDFIPEEEWEAANVPDSTLSFDGDRYVLKVRTSMVCTAMERFRDFVLP